MKDMTTLFEPLQAATQRMNLAGDWDESHPWFHQLCVDQLNGLLDVEYRGEYELWFADRRSNVLILEDLLRLFSIDKVARVLRSFTFRTPGTIAANGTCSINIDAFFKGVRRFPCLARFVIDQGAGEHGYRILASNRNGGDGDFTEAGVLADLLTWAPALEELVTPSPPSIAFFQGPTHPLRSLDVDTGFGHVNCAPCKAYVFSG